MWQQWQNVLYRRPRYLFMLLGMITVAGLSAFQALPRQEDPETIRRFAMVHTPFPGADAQRVESLVTVPLERALAEIPEFSEVLSRIRTGMSTISIELDPSVASNTEADEIWMRVQAQLTAAEADLPHGVRSRLQRFSTAAESLLVGLTWESESTPRPEILRRLMLDLQDQVTARTRPRDSTLYGVPVEEVHVTVDADALRAAGITVAEVAAALAGRDARAAAGSLRGAGLDLSVEMGGTLGSLADVGETVIRAGAFGEAIRVADVARLGRGLREPPESLVLVDGRPGMVLSVQAPEAARVDLWVRDVRRVLDEFAAELPEGIQLKVLFDQSVYTNERLGTLAGSLLLGLLLVLGVLVVVMGWRTASLVALALPLTLGASLAVMNAFSIPMNQISVSGLIIALGMLIDNAIIAVDAYGRHRRDGQAPATAIVACVGHLGMPLLASTTTTVLTFMPLVLMPGNAGDFIRDLGFAVVIALSLSFVLSLTVILAVAGLLDPDDRRESQRGWVGLQMPRLARGYERLLTHMLVRPGTVVVAFLLVAGTGFAASTTLVGQFFPVIDRDQFEVRALLPPGAGIEQSRRLAERLHARLDAEPDLVRSHWFVGGQPPRVYYNTTVRYEGQRNVAWSFVTARSAGSVANILPRLQRELSEEFPEAAILVLPFMQGPPLAAPLAFRIVGPDLDAQRQLGEELRLLLAETRGVTHAAAFVSAGEAKAVVHPNLEVIAAAGLKANDVAAELRAALEGVTGGVLLEGDEIIPVVTRWPEAQRQQSGSLMDLHLPLQPGMHADEGIPGVPLSALAHVGLEPVASGVYRRNGERLNEVQGYLEPYRMASPALAEFRQRLAETEFVLPPGYRLEFGGEEEGSGQAQGQLLSVLAPLLVAMLGVLVLAFNSFRIMFLVWVVAVSSIGFALGTLWLFNQPLGFMAVIGCMGVIGLAINDSVVMLAGIRSDPAAARGEAAGLVRIVMLETRHIISTTVTTIGGFSPLIIWGGNMWPPLTLALAGGLVGGALLSLFLVPSAYYLLLRMPGPALRPQGAAQAA
ncbi:MAG: efflux RND transporter permease subunit [Gammaproteobacteria bacterium]|nr:efflux RND transporter permease subunit [Gammaproteobacteria bacterium]